MMLVGCRVVRGPDWNLGNADKGEGHVGTVVNDNGNDTCDVVWDMGGKSTCRIGKGGKYDLRLLDNAPAGVKHLSIICDGCQKQVVVGTRWKCAVCYDFDLCTLCYFADKHDGSHSFKRFVDPSDKGKDVPKRSTSTTVKALGIFPGAKVARGVDWSFGNQDGGSGKKGKVEDIRPYGSDVGARNAVRVRWETSGEANVYRVGCRGKVDVTCVEESGGFHYYRDHLAVLGQKVDTSPPSSATRRSGLSSSLRRARSVPSVLQVGDKCVIDMQEDVLKEVQKSHGGWSVRMADCIGEVCVVKDFIGDQIIEVKYKDRTYQFFAGAVKKVEDIKVGDIVRITDDEDKAVLLQKNHGGWNSDMRETLNLVGKVVKIDSDGDVAVSFGQQAWVYNPGLLTPAPGEKPNTLEESTRHDSDESEELVDNFAQLFANLLLLKEVAARSTVTSEQLVVAAVNGDIDTVKKIISRKKELIDSTFKDYTPLMVAGNKGHLEIVKFLVESGANVNAANSDGVTAVQTAIAGKEEACAVYLIGKKANVQFMEKGNRTAAHSAAYTGQCKVLKAVLERGINPNKQDVEGDTCLHDAVQKRNDRAVAIILSHPHINLKIENKRGFNALLWAALKDHEFAVERIIENNQSLVEITKSDGYTPLHVAAVNDHQNIANLLILKGKANINCRNNQNLTPLHLAAHEAYPDMVRILVSNGADLTAKDDDGDTPLHVALMGRRQEGGNDLFTQLLGLTLNTNRQNQERFKIACIMIDKGANARVTNRRGATPLEVCRNDELRQAVSKYIAQKQGPQNARDQVTLNDLFSELPLPCVVCKDTMANARLLPCRHKIVCTDCCFQVRRCPLCENPISDRCDLQGRRIEPCRVQ